MNITYDMIDVILEDYDLRIATLYELLFELIDRAIDIHGIDLRTRDHTVAHFGVGEVERVLENLYLVVDLIAFWRIVDR